MPQYEDLRTVVVASQGRILRRLPGTKVHVEAFREDAKRKNTEHLQWNDVLSIIIILYYNDDTANLIVSSV